MIKVRKRSALWYFLRGPVYLYRWHLGRLLDHRFLLLTHVGRRTGLRRQTVLEVVQYRKQGPEAVVMSGFSDSNWLRNINANHDEAVTIGSQHFPATHRTLSPEEAVQVIAGYEHRNRWIVPIVRRGFSWLSGWTYRGTADDRRRLTSQFPLIAFRPRT